MFNYIIAFLAFLSLYKGVKFFLFYRRPKTKVKVMKGGEPFFLKRGKVGMLLIHGFTSTPWEFKEFGKFLAKNNVTVYAPLLPGHGTCPEDLARTTYTDWVDASVNALKKLRKHCTKVFLAGSSVGGNIAFAVAENNKVDGIISIGTPVRFRRERILYLLIPIVRLFKDYQKKHYLAKLKKYEYLQIEKKVHYKSVPLKKINDVLILTKKTRKIISKLKVPLLILQSSVDHLIDNNNAEYIYKKSTSDKKKIVYIPDSYHCVLNDKYKNRVYNEILSFIKSVRKKP